jgi:hypothetical protein
MSKGHSKLMMVFLVLCSSSLLDFMAFMYNLVQYLEILFSAFKATMTLFADYI